MRTALLLLLLFSAPDWVAHAIPVTPLTIQGSAFAGSLQDFALQFGLGAPEFEFAIFAPGMGDGPSYRWHGARGSAQKGVPSDLGGGVNFFNSGNVRAIQSGVTFGDFPTFLSGFLDFSVVIPDPQAGLAVVPFSLTGEVRGTSATGEEAFHYLLKGGGVVQAFITDPAPFCAPCPLLFVDALRFNFTTIPEPATGLLLAGGLASLMYFRKRLAARSGQ